MTANPGLAAVVAASRPAARSPGRLPMFGVTAGQAIAQTGSWAALVAALPLALDRTGTATWLAVITAAWAGPAMVARVAGRPMDRYGPRVIGAASWLAAAACAAAATAARSILVILLLLSVISLCRGAGVAAGDTAPTWLPHQPDVTRAGSWLVVAASIPMLAGPLGSASVLACIGPRADWGVVAGLFAAGAVISALVPAVRPAGPGPGRPAAGREPAGPRRDRGPVLAVLVITAGCWLSYGLLEILEPLYARAVLHSGLLAYGWMMVAFAAGATVTALAAIPLAPLTRRWWSVPAAALAVAAGERACTGSGSIAVALTGSAVWGGAAAAFSLACRSMILAATPAHSHGRALSTWRAVQNGAYITPVMVTGQLTAAMGLPAILAGPCILTALAALAYLVSSPAGAPRRLAAAALRRRLAPEP